MRTHKQVILALAAPLLSIALGRNVTAIIAACVQCKRCCHFFQASMAQAPARRTDTRRTLVGANSSSSVLADEVGI